MDLREKKKQDDGMCGEDQYCVQMYSRCAALMNEFCLDKSENNLQDISDAEQLLRQSIRPCDLGSTIITLISDERSDDQSIVQFDL